MHPLLQACAIVAGVVILSVMLGAVVARAIPPAGRDPVLRDLREDHAGSDTVS